MVISVEKLTSVDGSNCTTPFPVIGVANSIVVCVIDFPFSVYLPLMAVPLITIILHPWLMRKTTVVVVGMVKSVQQTQHAHEHEKGRAT